MATGRERAEERARLRQRSNTNGTPIRKSPTELAIEAGLSFGGIRDSPRNTDPDGFAGENFFRSPEEVTLRNNSNPLRAGQLQGSFKSGQLEEQSPQPFEEQNPEIGLIPQADLPRESLPQFGPEVPQGFDDLQPGEGMSSPDLFDLIQGMKGQGNLINQMNTESPLEQVGRTSLDGLQGIGDFLMDIPGVEEIMGIHQGIEETGANRRAAVGDVFDEHGNDQVLKQIMSQEGPEAFRESQNVLSGQGNFPENDLNAQSNLFADMEGMFDLFGPEAMAQALEQIQLQRASQPQLAQ